MSTFPIAGPFETRVAGTTIIKKSYADAVDAAFNGLYGATKSIVGLTLDGTGDVASTPLPAAVAFNINSGDTWQAIAYAFDATPTSAKPYFYVRTSDGSLAIANNATWIEITGKWGCIATGSNATRILQTNGVWKFQYHVATATPWVEASWVDVAGLDGTTDIATFVQNIVSTNGDIISVSGKLKGHRIYGNGTAMTTDKFFLSGGWGTSPPYSVSGTDLSGSITITPKAVVGANPLITFTFKDGTFTSVPTVVVVPDVTANYPATVPIGIATTATTSQWTIQTTPIIDANFTLRWFAVGV